MKKQRGEPTPEMFEALEVQIVHALVERLPELGPYAVKPQAVEYLGRSGPLECWVVARSGSAALFISVAPEKFGVGFVTSGGELDDVHFYPTPEIAVPAFMAAREAS